MNKKYCNHGTDQKEAGERLGIDSDWISPLGEQRCVSKLSKRHQVFALYHVSGNQLFPDLELSVWDEE